MQLNLQGIQERLDPGQAIAATQILPPMLAPYDPELPTRQVFDLDRAKEEMRLAGFPDGLSEPIMLWVRGEGSSYKAGEQGLPPIGLPHVIGLGSACAIHVLEKAA